MDAQLREGQRGESTNGGLSSAPSDIMELSRIEDRVSFAYFERCGINRADNAITVESAAGKLYVLSLIHIQMCIRDSIGR